LPPSGIGGSADDLLDLPPVTPRKTPKRRWMSIDELVTEVEVGLLVGERLQTGDSVYLNLQQEARRLREDNDRLLETAVEKTKERAKYVAQEDEMKFEYDLENRSRAELAEVVDVTQHIEKIDYELAGLKRRMLQNIKDVGSIKKTLSLIDKRGAVFECIDQVEESLKTDEVLEDDGPECKALVELVERLRDEFDRASPKIATYENDISALGMNIQGKELGLRSCREQPTQEADQIRMALTEHINKAVRMLFQLSRLRDIQRVNASEIGILERSRAKIVRHRKIRDLLADGDLKKLAETIDVLEGDNTRLRNEIKDLEAGLAPAHEEMQRRISTLRAQKDALTAETGKLREQIIAGMHKEELRKIRLAVLRGQKVQNFKFIAKLRAQLSSVADP
jgi:hypothetical protein